MKKLITIVLIFVFGALTAQNKTQESSESQKTKRTVARKVILENFTTAQCPACPPAHAFLEGYVENHPDAILIAQHAGYYTDPMTIPENTELLALYNAGGSTFAPGLSIDRHHYSSALPGDSYRPGPVFSVNANHSASATRIDDRLALPANVSLDITSAVVSGSTLTIDVEGELTETVSGTDLRLVVYIKEDGIISYQSNGGSNYEHNNVMRDAISETWGDSGIITSNTSGTTFSHQYTYTLDASWVVNNLSVVAFVANYDGGNVNNREILQADVASLAQPVGTNNIDVMEVDVPDTCHSITPVFKVKNAGSADITELSIDYSLNSGADTGNVIWTGNLPFNEITYIEIDEIVPTEILTANNIDFDFTLVNNQVDDDTSNNTISSAFGEAPDLGDDYLRVYIKTDGNGSQITWEITDSSNTVIESGGPYGNNETHNAYPVLATDCYKFSLVDSGGDGGCTVALIDSNQNTIYYSTGDYGSYIIQGFKALDTNAAIDESAFSDTSIFPNPANTELNIENAEGLHISLFDVLGRLVLTKNNISIKENVDITNLSEGTYILKLTDGVQNRIEKIVIAR